MFWKKVAFIGGTIRFGADATGGGLSTATTLPLLRISITVSPSWMAFISSKQCATKSLRLSWRVLVLAK